MIDDMMTLYHCVSARSFRPLWALEELGLPYELRMLPMFPRVHAREYLEINPLGTVPAFVDGDVLITESVAICQYLASKDSRSSLAVRPDEPAYGAYLNWLFFGEATLTFPQTIALRYGRFESEEKRVPTVAEDYRRWFLARLKGLERGLTQGQYLCGDRFTVADISVGYALMLAGYQDLEPAFPDSVRHYWTRLQQRDAYRRALNVQHDAALVQGVSTEPTPTYAVA